MAMTIRISIIDMITITANIIGDNKVQHWANKLILI